MSKTCECLRLVAMKLELGVYGDCSGCNDGRNHHGGGWGWGWGWWR